MRVLLSGAVPEASEGLAWSLANAEGRRLVKVLLGRVAWKLLKALWLLEAALEGLVALHGLAWKGRLEVFHEGLVGALGLPNLVDDAEPSRLASATRLNISLTC